MKIGEKGKQRRETTPASIHAFSSASKLGRQLLI
jgi:hypothetical protein